MEAYLIRKYRTDCTLGAFIGMDARQNILMSCVTLELPYLNNKPQVSAIPELIYDVVARESPKFGWHYHVLNVPERELILFHPATFVSQLLGCIIPGSKFADLNTDKIPDIVNTRATLNKMLAVMGAKFRLNVFSAPVDGGRFPEVVIHNLKV